MIRPTLLLASAGGLVAGLVLLATGTARAVGVYLVVSTLVVLAGLLLERPGYRPRVDRRRGHWRRTDERFLDPTSGALTEVRYNPETGERDYVEVDGREGPGSR